MANQGSSSLICAFAKSPLRNLRVSPGPFEQLSKITALTRSVPGLPVTREQPARTRSVLRDPTAVKESQSGNRSTPRRVDIDGMDGKKKREAHTGPTWPGPLAR
ncbi:unnamed protein product [Pleuronectes platessa]|uniref:Uncharacterized protein n=1 Tax=Pleuronectes platessa TaxID=8262 RepID=A0A9N7YD15_PLEPL|nr:unnamed protein product [Pleuronectes platessa]